MGFQVSGFFSDLKHAGIAWYGDNATRLASSLAYYTLLSLAPIMVLAVSLAGMVLGDEAARGQIAQEVAKFVGPEAGRSVQEVILHARAPDSGFWGTLVGVGVLFFGASGVFGELQSALNSIWKVTAKPGRGIWGVVRDRFTSFTMVLSVAFVLLVSLVLSAVLSALGSRFEQLLPGGDGVWQALNFGVAFVVISLLFALIFQVVPDVKLRFGQVWGGGVLTAFLFSVGKFALGFYLGHSGIASPYGAAGSVIVLVIWVYYSAQILFFGAEFTKVHAKRTGVLVKPSEHAISERPPSRESVIHSPTARRGIP
ncbi:MAG: YihY/virulence factor BrkB family protein [Myxococcales bacterium]